MRPDMKIAKSLALLSLVIGAGCASAAVADDKSDHPAGDVGTAHYLKVFGGQSVLVLGTQDRRVMMGVEYGYGKPDPRLAFRGYPAQLVSEVKLDYSRASGNFPEDPNSDLAIGAIFYAHYEFPFKSSTGYFVDWGGGAESINHTSRDLPLCLDGAIMVGAGYFTPISGSTNRLLIGLRYFHISNGGRKYPNFGQNQVQLTVGVRF